MMAVVRLTLTTLESREVPAVTIQFDYSFDTSGFFNDPTRRAVLQQAANDLTARINTPLAAIIPGGTNTWTERFVNPATGTSTSVANPIVAADTLVVYVAGREMPGDTIGETVVGNTSTSGSADWRTLIANRSPTGSSSWGGSTAFDTSENWHFGVTLDGIGSDQLDFYSVATHELGHILGLGLSRRWDQQTSGAFFVGPNAQTIYGGPVPLESDGGHWREGVMIDGQHTSMDPSLAPESRVTFTSLDYAALEDIGWTVTGTPGLDPGTTITQGNPQPWSGTWTSLATLDGVVVLSGQAAGTAQAFSLGTNGQLAVAGPSIVPFVNANSAIRTVAADFNGDGTPDLAFATGVGTSAAVRILNGRTGTDLVPTTMVLNGFDGGVYLTAGDVDGDGRAELAVSADAGGGNRVTVFRVTRSLNVAADFFAFDDANFRGGSRVALGDVNGDGAADLIVGAGIGGGPRIAVYDGKSVLAGNAARLVPDFFALDPSLRSGVFVTAADLDGDKHADVAYSTGNTGGPRVRIVSGQVLTDNPGQNAFNLSAMADFFALDPNDRNGLRIAARDLNADGQAELIVASGARSTAQVRVLTLSEMQSTPTSAIQDPFGGQTTFDGVYVG